MVIVQFEKPLLVLTGSTHVTVATAFLLALFSHTLNHVIIRLQSSLYDRQNPNKLLESGMTQGEVYYKQVFLGLRFSLCM
jgi:hypothetical protein